MGDMYASQFIADAFNEEKKDKIPTVNVAAEDIPEHKSDAGNNTNDKVFLISMSEAEKYFSSNMDRQCSQTEYARTQGARSGNYYGNCPWRLRTLGLEQSYTMYVIGKGEIRTDGSDVDDEDYAIRPAMWIELT